MMNDPVNPNHIGDDSVASTRMTTQSSLSSLAPKTAQRTSLGHRFQRALTGGPNRRFPGLHPSPGGAASLSLFSNRRLALPILAILALLAASLLFLQPGSPLQAQDGGTIEYAENGTDPVATYTAVDPEGAAIKWSLSGADEADFTIAGGVLAFAKSPDFEDAKDEGTDNIYEIMVEATDGTGHVGRKAVMVEVTNVDEDGTVELSALQPASSVPFTATLTDIDNPSADLTGSAEWQWSKSMSASGGWADIDKATSSVYTPEVDGADSGYYLRATAKYKDKQSPSGAGNDKTASMVSANKVLALRTSNKAPEFAAVQDPDGETANEMAIAKRDVAETAEAGQLVGDPVTAEDDDANDVLTYTLALVDASSKFVIDRATGQISVAKGAEFNHGGDDDIDGADGDTYMVTVIATDPTGEPLVQAPEDDNIDAAGAYGTVGVLITVTEVDEPPVFTVTGGVEAGKFAAVSFDETNGIDDEPDVDEIGTALFTFTANDAETAEEAANMVTLGIRGADSSKFDFDPVVDQPENYTLKFKDEPDFEDPADADEDNVYEVTITATDGNANMSTRDVKVTVTNAEEDGTVKLSQPRPRVGVAITASYSDPDGGLASAEWQWWRTADFSALDTVPTLPGLEAPGGDWEMIEGATSASYMPVAGAEAVSDVGRYLLAVVSYTDAKQNVDGMPKDMAGMVSANPVAVDTRNRAPVFRNDDGEMIASTTREVAENTKGDVGNAVTAVDPDPNADPLIYTLSGADAALFSVGSPGQIKVKTGTKLDFETRTTYMVTVTATDSFSDSASIDVTITVTDADEAPDVTGDATKEYAENGTGSVATYMAEDPEGVAVKWSLSGADDSLFSIKGGVLTFVKSPNFEAPGDAGPDNIYDVMVEATDGTGHVGRKAVKVEVTNVDEAGTVELSALQPARSVAFTATLTDIDGPTGLTGIAEWQWSRSTRTTGGWTDIDKATGSAYTPEVDGADSGYYLRATATYKDKQSPSGAGNDKTASMVSANKVLTLRLSNKAPEFAAIQDPDGETANEMAIAKRDVAETAEAGQLVGDPVTAEDDDANDVLTYTLALVDASSKFVIDRATGQISVAKGAEFNHGGDEDIDGADGDTYMVTVIATDPTGEPLVEAPEDDNIDAAGAYGTVGVLITVTEVDEPPVFTVTGGVEAGKFAAVSFDETNGIDDEPDVDEIGTALFTFTANDAETAEEAANMVTLGIRGADSSKFDFDPVVDETANYTLKFKAAPNFEDPADADEDNVYEVTITATDGNANMATRDVKVTVTNAEEPGEVTLSQTRPRVGVAITASYSDPDGGLASAEWQWWRTADFSALDTVPTLPGLETPGGDWEMIEGATSASYMPVAGAEAVSDVGRYLLAVVSYTDAKQNVDGMPKDMAGMVSANPVAVDTRNRAPVFRNDDGDMIASTTREVAENTKGDVGNAVTAVDPDPNADPLTYRLSGADAALFSVDRDGQITGKTGTKLDFETRTTYMVTITATDSFSESASIDVTIMVIDVDEEPKISEGGLAITGSVNVDYAEDRRDAVATYSATGPESANTSWTLDGDDAGPFNISSSGELTFRSGPDFESPADADTDNEYLVTVEADDDTYTATRDVVVTVTDVEEDGTVSLSTQQPRVGTAITATLTDADGGVTGTAWQWANATVMDGTYSNITGATSDSYTPVEEDANMHLRATASYTDGEGSGKTAIAVSENPVTAGDPLLVGYDVDKDGWIQLQEARVAVGDYFSPPKGVKLSLVDTRKVVGLYFEYKNSQ